jgi:large subunit ribosomal protein L47
MQALVSRTTRLLLGARINGQASSTLKYSSDVTTKEEGAITPIPKKEKVDPHKFVLKQRYASNPAPLMEFFEPIQNWAEKQVRSGREWKTEELRIKSNEDLHKLWYVLLKERNMLMTMKDAAKEENELFASPERLDRVEQSMINIETVVKERNKAYMELEVGAGETNERVIHFRRDLFGQHQPVPCREHIIPYWMNTKWRKLYGPGHGKYVNEFIQKMRDKKSRKIAYTTLSQHQEVRQLLRRFPNIDLDELQAKYPKVPVRYYKDHLDFYNEQDYKEYSDNTFKTATFESEVPIRV